jgi:hypothetical protein
MEIWEQFIVMRTTASRRMARSILLALRLVLINLIDNWLAFALGCRDRIG